MMKKMFHMQCKYLSSCSSLVFFCLIPFFSETFHHSASIWTRAHVSNELAERLWGEIHLARMHAFSRRPPQGYAQQHKALWAPNDAAWASFDLSPSQASLGPSQHLHRQLQCTGADEVIFIFSPLFFFNEACSSNEDQQNPWCLVALGNHRPAPTWLTHSHSLLSQALWRQPKQMGLTYPQSSLSSISFFIATH